MKADKTQKLSAAVVAVAIAAAMPITLPLVQKWESGGKTYTVPYKDIVGVWTVCDGETRVKMRVYTPAECRAMTEKAVAEFGEQVLKCTPSLHDRPQLLAASISVAYNIGSAGYCRSSMARQFNRGNYTAGCQAFLLWNKAGGTAVRGLTLRRREEAALCSSGVK